MLGVVHGPSWIAPLNEGQRLPAPMAHPSACHRRCSGMLSSRAILLPNIVHLDNILKNQAKINKRRNSVYKELREETNFPMLQ